MPVNQSDRLFFEKMEQIMGSMDVKNLTIETIREATKKMSGFAADAAPLPYYDTSILTRDNYHLPLRHYQFDDTPRAVIIYFPGNGFIHDLFVENHAIISKIAEKAHCHAIMVNVRLAPENPFPIPLNDALDAINYIFNNASSLTINHKKIILAGFSSGANLAAVSTNQLRHHPHIAIYHQLLISGAYDYTDSLHEFDDFVLQDKMLDPKSAKFSFDCYSRSDQRKEPVCSPYWEKDLSKLPSTTIMMGEYDGGRSQGEGYAKKLVDAGNQVEKIIGKGQTHGTILYRKACIDGSDPALVAGERLRFILKN